MGINPDALQPGGYIMDCKECAKRGECTELCNDALAYANQDRIGQRYTIISQMDIDEELPGPDQWPQKTTIETILQLFFVDRKKQTEIAKLLMVSQQYVSKIISQYRPIITENIKKSVVLGCRVKG
jgi:DNA-directed RNA polymerase specialized sigma subunit